MRNPHCELAYRHYNMPSPDVTEQSDLVATEECGYYEGYDDPEADMVIQTSDGHRFRVHSYDMRAAR